MNNSVSDKIILTLARSRYIVPCKIIRRNSGEAPEKRFNEGGIYKSITALLENSPHWQQITDNSSLAGKVPRSPGSDLQSDLYRHILNTLSINSGDDNPSYYSIGSSWECTAVRDNPPEILWFPKNNGNASSAANSEHNHSSADRIAFKIVRAGIFVFRTGICLFWFETGAPGGDFQSPFADLERFIHFQKCIKELSAPWQRRMFWKIISPEGLETKKFITGVWISGILKELLADSDLETACYSSRKLSEEDQEGCAEAPDNALIFDLTNMKGQTPYYFEEIRRYLTQLGFMLSNGFSQRYLMPEDAERHAIRPFANVLWTASSFGTGQYVVYSDDSKSFFEDILPDRMFSDYFLIYIILLYQHYSILYYSEQLELSFPSELKQIKLNTLNSFSERINLFLIKSVYASVSHLEQHNAVYRYLSKTLRINDNIRDLTVGLDSLGKLIRNRSNDEDTAREKKIQKTVNTLALLIIASTLTDTYSFLNENVPDLVSGFAAIDLSLSFGSLWWSLFKAAVILWIIVIFVRVVLKLRKNRK